MNITKHFATFLAVSIISFIGYLSLAAIESKAQGTPTKAVMRITGEFSLPGISKVIQRIEDPEYHVVCYTIPQTLILSCVQR